MSSAWRKYIAPNLSQQEKKRARVYFPVVDDFHAFESTLGRGFMAKLDMINKPIYNFLLDKQPFSSKDNQWLKTLSEVAAEGKHLQLVPQKRTESRQYKVTNNEGVSVSWDPSIVTYGQGVSVVGAPIDPRTQRIIPTEGVTEQLEVWISFIIENYRVNALGFCKDSVQKTRVLIDEMSVLL